MCMNVERDGEFLLYNSLEILLVVQVFDFACLFFFITWFVLVLTTQMFFLVIVTIY